MTPSEKLVHDLCLRSFLSPWSFANPLKNLETKKELCDILVVCDPDVVVFSVKEIVLARTDGAASELSAERWRRKAVDDSVKQLDGAVRALEAMTHVLLDDAQVGLELPPVGRRRVHRVAVALGSDGEVPLASGALGKGQVHVFDEVSLDRILGELDTVTDFTHYLRAKEDFLDAGKRVVVMGGEENLLAHYLHTGRKFADGHDVLVIDNEHWTSIAARPEVVRRKDEDKVSYVWDGLIETLARDYEIVFPMGASQRSAETVVRVMAREHRFARRMLASQFVDGLRRREAMARVQVSGTDPLVSYVFLYVQRTMKRAERQRVLTLRCMAVRDLYPDRPSVVGIAAEVGSEAGSPLDAVFFHAPNWSDEDSARTQRMCDELGWFRQNVRQRRVQADEFPT